MANTRGRIKNSTNPAEILEVSATVYAKHLSEGNRSQLNSLVDYDWSDVGPTIEMAKAKHALAEKLKGEMEAAYRERDLLMPPIVKILKASKNLLKAINSKNPKRLTEWGFSVDDTPKSKPKP